ncbi:AraC family transcriptional regulator [Flavilitoribacter nigricans]|uniref:HTH araC/xylS-type domain-containing protein n=1 Tax=Flavilitoribacter nigricans (strain ATCC 23147 / DSM 23189 / NBRC 102662 / NCIMB 1420 / SS-2) TaxID=1122177 RepID=A0A2D0N3P2_FLAN2|nr:helix-turn-helix transcriptional regulator [Flavilitoribacter nigricans]PHN02769.1 hypothetical protein CRP01_30770 [Flavilitoribacter nigricans DSM 23189 = NBRC 102662]
MIEDPIHIKFQNRQNPQAGFDLIRLEDLLSREYTGHSPQQLHRVEFYIIILVERGRGGHTIDFVDYPYEKGTLITIRKDQIHRFHTVEGVRGTLLLFTDEFLISYLEALEALKSLQLFNELLGVPKIQLDSGELDAVLHLIQRIESEYFTVNDEYSLGIIRSELHILLAKLFRIKSHKNQIVANRKYLRQFIDLQNLVEQQATTYSQVQEYAKVLGVSTRTLNTITRNIINKSAKQFIDDIHTKQIKRLLINTELTVKEIAFESGFDESTNFYKYFKRQTGLTPEQFRSSF